MTSAIDDLVEAARKVPIAEAAERLGLAVDHRVRSGQQRGRPCPSCGGRDRFFFNTAKNLWNCRGSDGGNDAIGMVAHCEGLSLSSRAGFLEACSIVTGIPVPQDAERESEEERRRRRERIEAQRLQNLEEQARSQTAANDFRERERDRARGIYEHALPLGRGSDDLAVAYLSARSGMPPARAWRCGWLRYGPDVTYWHGQDEFGRPASIWRGPAMVAPFVSAGLDVIGCHITWIDLARPPKFRPDLFDPRAIACDRPEGEALPTKKMRGSKKGGIIPVAGDIAARRWVGGEGIENVAAFAGWEGLRADTLYFAGGDLGNLAGPAEPSSRFPHPTLTRPDRNGRPRPVMVAGPVPRRDQEPDDAMWIADHVDELVLLADGDSERVMTAAAMARARRRAARPGRVILILWPRPGYDFSRMAAEACQEAAS